MAQKGQAVAIEAVEKERAAWNNKRASVPSA